MTKKTLDHEKYEFILSDTVHWDAGNKAPKAYNKNDKTIKSQSNTGSKPSQP